MEVLMEHGVPEERIIFLNLVAAPEGLANVFAQHPSVKVISAWVDEGLNEKKLSDVFSNDPCPLIMGDVHIELVSLTLNH